MLQLTQRLGLTGNIPGSPATELSSVQNSKLGVDLNVLDKLVTSILERHDLQRTASPKLQRLKSSMSRSRNNSTRRTQVANIEHQNCATGTVCSQPSAMPTIMETNNSQRKATSSWSERTSNVPGVRQIINTITNAPHRFSQGGNIDEENTNLTNNMLD